MLIRAVRTFFQAAIGYIAANLAMGLTGAVEGAVSLKSALTALIAAAVSCGLAAVMNLPKKDAAAQVPEAGEKNSGAEPGKVEDVGESDSLSAGDGTGEEEER